MSDLPIARTKKLKEIILLYLHGEALSDINFRLYAECSELKMSCKSLYKSIRLKEIPNDPLIEDILNSLNIRKSLPPVIQGQYEKLLESEDLYELLINLSHDGHRHLNYLIQLIDNTKPKTNWSFMLIISAISSAGLGTLFYLHEEYIETIANWCARTTSSFIGWMGRTFSLIQNIPLLGITYTGLILIWNLYTTFAHGTSTTTEKLNNIVFRVAAASLIITAYILSYVAAGAITIPAAIFFVLSASVDVVQSIFNWFRSQTQLQALSKPEVNTDPNVIAEYERAKNFHQLDQNTVWVKVSAAALTTVAMAIWNFFPPSLLITIFCVAFVALLTLAKGSIQTSFDEANACDLQRNLLHITNGYKPEPSPSIQNIKSRLVELEIREEALRTKEAIFDQHQAAIINKSTTSIDELSSSAQILLNLSKIEHITTARIEPINLQHHDTPTILSPANDTDMLSPAEESDLRFKHQ